MPRSRNARSRGPLVLRWRGIPLRCTRSTRGWQSITRRSDDFPRRDGESSDHPLIELIERQISRGWEPEWSLLDLDSCTDFTRRVLQQTALIPTGTTRSYGEIARAIDTPGAARAVGQALRRNPLPLLIPCHRVIRADGSPGGYGGRNRNVFKPVLLEIESAARSNPA